MTSRIIAALALFSIPTFCQSTCITSVNASLIDSDESADKEVTLYITQCSPVAPNTLRTLIFGPNHYSRIELQEHPEPFRTSSASTTVQLFLGEMESGKYSGVVLWDESRIPFMLEVSRARARFPAEYSLLIRWNFLDSDTGVYYPYTPNLGKVPVRVGLPNGWKQIELDVVTYAGDEVQSAATTHITRNSQNDTGKFLDTEIPAAIMAGQSARLTGRVQVEEDGLSRWIALPWLDTFDPIYSAGTPSAVK